MPGPVQSVERAAAILRLLAGRPGRMSLSEVSAALALPRGTAHGLLRTLQLVGFVEHDPGSGRYQLGAALLHLGTSYLDINELRSRAINWADPLAARTGEAVRLGTLLDRKVLIVHHVFRPDDSLQVLDVGTLLPAHASALGKVLLAFDATQAAAVESGGLDRYTKRTIVDVTKFRRELARVRATGWSLECGELQPDDAGLAAPIRGAGGLVVGAIGITGSAQRVCDAHGNAHPALVEYVCKAARAVSRDLGATRW